MIEGISANDALYGTTGAAAAGAPTNELGQDAFLQLLISQLKNQDPLEPTTNDQFISQLAQFSSLEEMEKVNENLLGLALLQQSNALISQLTDSSALIGQSVVYADPSTGEATTGVVSSVKLEEGLAILNIGGTDIPLANVQEVIGAALPEAEPATSDPATADPEAETTESTPESNS